MSTAHQETTRPNGHDGMFSGLMNNEKVDRFIRSPKITVPRPGKQPMNLHTDRVRARPAIAPNVSMMLGDNAIGLGLWGLLAPRSVSNFLGLKASDTTIRTVFGAREMVTGVTLASDPTKAGMLWARVAGDAFDIAVLRSLTKPGNPKASNAKLALGVVVIVTALDLYAAYRLTTVRRNCR